MGGNLQVCYYVRDSLVPVKAGASIVAFVILRNLKIMSSRNNNLPKNGAEHSHSGYHSIFGRSGNYDLSHYQTSKPGMEPKLLAMIASILGIPIYGWAIYLNIGTWKGNVLFTFAVTFMIIKIVFYFVKQYQDARLREWEYQQKIKEDEEPNN